MICVGDLHGNVRFLENIIKEFKDERLLFVGDILDSYDFSIVEQIEALDIILDLVLNNDAVLIKGNHEISYCFPDSMKCSGYKNSTAAHFMTRASKYHRLAKEFLYEYNILYTHAGLSQDYLRNKQGDLATFLEDSITNHNSFAYNVGHSRGGSAQCGGIFWCDFYREFVDPEDVDLIQVFGHTPTHSSIVCVGQNYNIDCLQTSPSVLQIERKKATSLCFREGSFRPSTIQIQER